MAPSDSNHRRPILDERCARHQFEAAVDQCRQCGFAFCPECLVYAFGERQPPFCIPCALAAAGVRSGAARQPAMPRKELRRREKEAKRAAKESAQVAAAQAAEPQIDWSLPLNGSAASTHDGTGAAGVNGNGNGHSPVAPGDAPPAHAPSPVAPYPTFDDEPNSSGRPQPPSTPPKASPKVGLFGRRKGKVVPF
jgi:hypothetical protein